MSLADLSDAELLDIVARSSAFAEGATADAPLKGAVVGVYFRKTSTRTRTAFSAGALRLGAQVLAFGPNDLQLNTGETVPDTGQVLSCMLDGLVARTADDPAELRVYADQDRMSVVNAMSADEHPTQAITDLSTMLSVFGRLAGLRVLYVGEGNNTAAPLAMALARVSGTEVHLRTPPGYGVLPDKIAMAHGHARASDSYVEERHDMTDLPAAVDVIYTSRWQTTGTSKADPDWRSVFAPFRVDEVLMDRYPHALFMHDLPAHRGEEVEAAVLDGPRSIVFRQAAHKLYSAMAVLEWCLTGGRLGHLQSLISPSLIQS